VVLPIVACGLLQIAGTAGGQESVDDLPEILTLEAVVARARSRGLDARAALGARNASRWQERAFRARLWPQLRLEGTLPNYNRAITQVLRPDGTSSFVPQEQMYSSVDLTIAQPVPEAGGELILSSGLSRLDLLGDPDTRLWQTQPLVVGWRQSLFQPRRVLWDKKELRARSIVAEQRYLETLEDIAAGATAAYFDVYAAHLAQENAVANAAVNDTLYVLSRGRYEVGRIGENDLLQSELALLRARASVEEARLELSRAMAALRIELDIPEGEPITIADPPPAIAIDLDTTLAVTQAMQNQSRARQIESDALSARRNLTEARLSNRLNATLTATVGLDQTATDLEKAYRHPLDRQQLGIAVSLPLWQWGAGKADVEAALAAQDSQESIAIRARREISQEAVFATRELELAQRQLELAAKADTVAAKRFEVAKNRYIIGKIGIADLYLGQTEKDAALQSYIRAVRAYWLAYYRLRRITLYDFAEGKPIGD
jgi:outer membrane protein TolC